LVQQLGEGDEVIEQEKPLALSVKTQTQIGITLTRWSDFLRKYLFMEKVEENNVVPLLSEQRSLAGSIQGFQGMNLQIKKSKKTT